MVAEPWILKMGNQVSNNLKNAFFVDPSKKNKKSKRTVRREPLPAATIGILSFEVANVMSKTVHLYKSLTDAEISRLRTEILKSDGIRNVVSDDESYLLELVVAEKLDDLNRVAAVVSRLGKKCSEPALLGFEHIYADICSGRINVRELGFLVKNMDGMVRKMERYVGSTSNLYNELEVLNELEQATKKFQQNQCEESCRAFEQKVIWQKQDVSHLKDISLWNQTFDKIVGLLARTVCTVFARICFVFGDSVMGFALGCGGEGSTLFSDESRQFSHQIAPSHHQILPPSGPLRPDFRGSMGCNSGPLESLAAEKRDGIGSSELSLHLQRREINSFRHDNFSFPCGSSPGRLLMECLSLSSSASSKLDEDCVEHDVGSCRSGFSALNWLRREDAQPSGCLNQLEPGFSCSRDPRQHKCSNVSILHFGPKNRLMMHAPPSSIGGSALALHYANVIIVIEKLLRYPHLVGDETRDDLYQMLPTSLRMSLRMSLKSYVKSLAIYDAPLAHDWKETLDKILKWLAPLAHNMIRWQTERNFEQHQIVTRTNVLLLQTVYFADRQKTEAAICELLVGLNYICRYEQQQNALLDCASSVDFDSCMDWQLQY